MHKVWPSLTCVYADVSLSTVVLNSRDWSKKWCPKFWHVQNPPYNRRSIQNTTNLLWLQHKTFICWPSLTLPTLIIHMYLVCFYNSTKATTNIWGIIFTRIVAQGYYYFFYPKTRTKPPNSAALRHYSRMRYYKILHSCAYNCILNITFLLTINDNSYNSFNCLQLCNTWGSYIQGYIWMLDIGGHLELS